MNQVLINTLIEIGIAGVVALVLWLVIHFKTKALSDQIGDVKRDVEKLTDSQNSLAREFSELRGQVHAWRGIRPLDEVTPHPVRQK